MKLTSPPKLSAFMEESPLYRVLGVGFTDNIFLLGHSDHLPLNEPYGIGDMKEAMRTLGGDTDSPLVRAAIEAYYGGARDIWLVAVAPMEEYEPDIDLRDAAYYQTYSDRLMDTYKILKKWDIADITIPIDAPFNSSVDFLTPLTNYCVEAFDLSGNIHLGLLGTRGVVDADLAEIMSADPRVESLGASGKFVSVFAGDGTFHFKQLPFNHTSSVVVSVASRMVRNSLDRGVTYQPLPNVSRITGRELDKDTIKTLAEAGINYVGPNIKGRRGQPYQCVAHTDNTLALDGSDYWSLLQMRLVSAVNKRIRAFGNQRLGTIGYGLFVDEVEDYLVGLVATDAIREYQLHIERDPFDRGRVLVDVVLTPFFGVRDIEVNVTVGPS